VEKNRHHSWVNFFQHTLGESEFGKWLEKNGFFELFEITGVLLVLFGNFAIF
jgi:hypothetical protein